MTRSMDIEAHRVFVDDDLRRMWRDAGGEFYGPRVETGSMPEKKLLPFLREIYARAAAAEALVAEYQGLAVTEEICADRIDRRQSFQTRVQPWLLECFGETIAGDREERNHRFLEEALELVQAAGCSRSEAHQLVDYVYDRDVGRLPQEVGGVMVTLAALCLAHGVDMHAEAETELSRVWTKVEQIRAKQAAKPKHSPLPEVSSPTPPAAVTDEMVSVLRRVAEGERSDAGHTALKEDAAAALAAPEARLKALHQIADGVFGNGPATRGRARDEIAALASSPQAGGETRLEERVGSALEELVAQGLVERVPDEEPASPQAGGETVAAPLLSVAEPDLASTIAAEIMALSWCRGSNTRQHSARFDDIQGVVANALAPSPHPAPAVADRAGWTLADLRDCNTARQAAWCPDQVPDLSFRGNELAGEVGEACNVVKKLERERHGWFGSRATVEQLAEELADVVICADLCGLTAGVDLMAAVRAKFDATSEKVGLPHRLTASPPASSDLTGEGV